MESVLFSILIYPLIFILPAWVANGAPVVFGGGAPLDFNKKFMGKPLFGKHKTIRGTISGLCSGFIIALIEYPLFSNLLLTGIMLSVGTIFGDLAGSFIKRRISIKEGSNVPLMDQYMFLIFAFLFALPFGNFPDPAGILVIVVLTGILHRITNLLAYIARIKKVPW